MIDYELRKLNFPPLDDNFMKFVLSEFSKLSQQYTSPPAIKSKFMLDNSPKIPMLPQQEENSSSAPQSVEIIRVKRSRTVPLEQKIDSTDCRIISKDADIYDIDTGGLIASSRKGSVRQSAIEGINKYAFNVTLELLQTAGAQSKSDTFHIDAKNKKKTVPQSAPFGILGLLQQNVALTNLTTSYPYNIETISYLGEAIEDLGKVYQRVAPEEFSYCETAMSPLQEYIIFPNSKITCAVEFNYDKQTSAHKDRNKFPGKRFGFLSCFYDSQQKRYSGGYTILPEYGIGFDVEQGDCLIADFENIVHANTPIVPLDSKEPFILSKGAQSKKMPNWHRASLVGYTRGSLLEKTERFSYENSDDESEQDFSTEQIKEELEGNSLPRPRRENQFAFFMREASRGRAKRGGKNLTTQNEDEAKELYERRNSYKGD